jgi:flagellar basal body-associated protein FliL
MSFRDADKSNRSRIFSGKSLIIIIIIVAVVPITFAVWFFFISDADNAFEDTKNVLPPNCYSINGKQTCPKK